MPVTEIGDPRLQALFGSDGDRSDVRPAVRLPSRGVPSAVIIAGAILLGLMLFALLNARRTDQGEPSEASGAGSQPLQFVAPPPLQIPPAPAPLTSNPSAEQQNPLALPPSPPAAMTRVVQPQSIYAPQPFPQPAPQLAPLPAPAPLSRTSAGSPLVIDSSAGAGGAAAVSAAGSASPFAPTGQGVARMRASAFANRSMTVPQGYLIHAVLETGFDSTKPGFARAVVARDVRGFDGKNVLIPRGSRLIGEYGSDVAQAQKRVAIVWTRLIRPDGMTIGLESPAVDTLGRGGVPASVNTHFIQRLGDALLQSSFEVGRVLAGRAVNDPVIVVSGNTATASQIMPATNYVPTLKVPAGKSISVFVAHDLDFSAAGSGR